MNIRAVIVTYNGEKWIRKCLDSLYRSSVVPGITVIDNNSVDNTVATIKEYPGTNLIAMPENLGFGKANNIGIKEALQHSPGYILLINQDAWVEPDVLENLIALHKSNPGYGVLSPVHLNGKGTTLDKGFKRYSGLTAIPDDKGMRLATCPFINAAIWLIPAPVFRIVGGFDPAYPHYGEDFDWSRRLTYHGYKSGYCPALKGYHDREDRPQQTSAAFMKHEYIYFLTVMKDINRPYKAGLLKLWKEVIHNGIRHRKPKEYFNIALSVLTQKKEIRKTREMVKSKGSHFLG